jgi:hypothetical protein
MDTFRTHIAFTVAAANPAGASMRSLAVQVAAGAKTTHAYSLTEMYLR